MILMVGESSEILLVLVEIIDKKLFNVSPSLSVSVVGYKYMS